MRYSKYLSSTFLVLFNVLQGSILYYLHLNNLSKDIVFTIKQLVDGTLLSLVAHNAKT